MRQSPQWQAYNREVTRELRRIRRRFSRGNGPVSGSSFLRCQDEVAQRLAEIRSKYAGSSKFHHHR